MKTTRVASPRCNASGFAFSYCGSWRAPYAHSPGLAAGRTALGEVAALLARCRLVVGADTGPMHLAVALGVPTVHLYGPFEPELFGPWGNPTRHRIVRAPSGRVLDVAVADVLVAAAATVEATALRS